MIRLHSATVVIEYEPEQQKYSSSHVLDVTKEGIIGDVHLVDERAKRASSCVGITKQNFVCVCLSECVPL